MKTLIPWLLAAAVAGASAAEAQTRSFYQAPTTLTHLEQVFDRLDDVPQSHDLVFTQTHPNGVDTAYFVPNHSATPHSVSYTLAADYPNGRDHRVKVRVYEMLEDSLNCYLDVSGYGPDGWGITRDIPCNLARTVSLSPEHEALLPGIDKDLVYADLETISEIIKDPLTQPARVAVNFSQELTNAREKNSADMGHMLDNFRYSSDIEEFGIWASWEENGMDLNADVSFGRQPEDLSVYTQRRTETEHLLIHQQSNLHYGFHDRQIGVPMFFSAADTDLKQFRLDQNSGFIPQIEGYDYSVWVIDKYGSVNDIRFVLENTGTGTTIDLGRGEKKCFPDELCVGMTLSHEPINPDGTLAEAYGHFYAFTADTPEHEMVDAGLYSYYVGAQIDEHGIRVGERPERFRYLSRLVARIQPNGGVEYFPNPTREEYLQVGQETVEQVERAYSALVRAVDPHYVKNPQPPNQPPVDKQPPIDEEMPIDLR